MKILKFTLSGKTAFFKDRSVNSVVYFTHGNIHKVAVLGIFGAIMGYGGYSEQFGYIKENKKKEKYPPFYEKFKDTRISIVPNSKNGNFPKKQQVFNNSVGYASKEETGNLIVKEIWLENPSWDIYIQITSGEAEKLAERLMERTCVYIPYLGTRDHIADIYNVEMFDFCEVDWKNVRNIDCLVPEDLCKFSLMSRIEMMTSKNQEKEFKMSEFLPMELDGDTNQHILKKMVYTNMKLKESSEKIYKVNEKNIVFY